MTALGLVSAPVPSDEAAKAGLPNILLITVDTLRADHLSSYGYHKQTSPRIDQLAAEGTRFDRAHTVIPLTGPSHLSMFTGRYPQEHGARVNGTAPPKNSRWLSLPQILRRFGYRSSAFVSAWPLIGRLTGLHRWFDDYDQEMTSKYDVIHASRDAPAVTRAASRWLGRNHEKPFFLWTHYFDPHAPYELHSEFADLPSSGHVRQGPEPIDAGMAGRIRKYDSEIAFTDSHVGALLDEIDRLGLRDSTLVVLTADHGEALGEHGYVGHGRRLDEGIARVPLIVRYPGTVPADRVVAEPVTLLDVTPTLLDLSGITKLAGSDRPWSFAGRSLADAIKGNERLPVRPMRYVAFAGRKGFAPSWMSWMWFRPSTLPLKLGRMTGSEKFVWTPGEGTLAMIDLEQDPFEQRPTVLAEDDLRYAKETAELRRWFESPDLEESELKISERDTEVLKSLGYLQ